MRRCHPVAGRDETPQRRLGSWHEEDREGAGHANGGLRFDTRRAAVLAGRVTVKLTNDSTVEHNVTIAQGSRTLGATKTITESADTITLELGSGAYVFYCSVAGHRESGMEGTLTVE